jgi:hypothetical protein
MERRNPQAGLGRSMTDAATGGVLMALDEARPKRLDAVHSVATQARAIIPQKSSNPTEHRHCLMECE